MQDDKAITTIDPSSTNLKHLASGKVRELFEVDSDTLLFVATDRISAYDVILTNGIPGKGDLLTQLSSHWFKLIESKLPSLRHHLISTDLPSAVGSPATSLLKNRSMQVKRLQPIPLESIVRGYITGSAWTEYKAKGTVHGFAIRAGMRESEKFDQAIWTPSTKAEIGEHDENISKERAAETVGAELAEKVEKASLAIYAIVSMALTSYGYSQLNRRS